MVVYRIKDWNAFKRLILLFSPKTVFYIVQPHPLRCPLLGLRITFYNQKDMYLFIDYANNGFLYKTRISITNYEKENIAEIKDEHIIYFLSKHIGKINISSLPPFMY